MKSLFAWSVCLAGTAMTTNVRADENCEHVNGVYTCVSQVEDLGGADYEFEARTGAAPREPKVFRIEEYCKDYNSRGECTARFSSPGEVFEYRDTAGNVIYSGTIGQYIKLMNQLEAQYAQNGHTLAVEESSADDEVNEPFHVPTDPAFLKEQLLSSLQLNTEDLLVSIFDVDPKDDCPLFKTPGDSTEMSHGDRFPRILLPKINNLPLDQVIYRFNEQQKKLCSFGFSIFDVLPEDLPQSPEELVSRILELRDELLKTIGLSGLEELFSMETVQTVAAVVDIGKDIYDLIEAKKVPSPEQLMDLTDKLNAVLPREYQIPAIPNIPGPTPPERPNHIVKKKKDWSGFNFGKQNRVATSANAYVKITGTQDGNEQAMTAYGDGAVYIFSQKITVIGGYADAEVKPETGAKALVELQVFGQNVIAPAEDETTDREQPLELMDPAAFAFELEKSYQKTFLVAGVVPVTVGIGGKIEGALGYSLGVYWTQVKGTVTPTVSAFGHAFGGVGVPGLSGGARGDMVLLEASVPLTGYAAIQFDDVGYPYLKVGIDSSVRYEALKGRFYAYGEYPVPRVGIPPFKKKRSEYDIFRWGGHRGDYKIMNWGLEFGRNEVALNGDILDQTDRAEFAHFEDVVTLQAKEEAIVQLTHDTIQRAEKVFAGLAEELATSQTQRIRVLQDYVPDAVDAGDRIVRASRDKLIGMITLN